jgi:hypothetical protein
MLFKASLNVNGTRVEGNINSIAVINNLPKPKPVEETKDEQPKTDYVLDSKHDWY